MGGILKRELLYIWYYFEVQLSQIFWYWVIGMAVGSLISVFAKVTIGGKKPHSHGGRGRYGMAVFRRSCPG